MGYKNTCSFNMVAVSALTSTAWVELKKLLTWFKLEENKIYKTVFPKMIVYEIRKAA